MAGGGDVLCVRRIRPLELAAIHRVLGTTTYKTLSSCLVLQDVLAESRIVWSHTWSCCAAGAFLLLKGKRLMDKLFLCL